MSIAHLQITNLRNIQSARVNCHPHLNFIIGENGSGKTSFLEGIYLLSTGHSFRSREISPLISNGQSSLTMFAQTFENHQISVQKSLQEPTRVLIDHLPCASSSIMSRLLPVQLLYQTLFQIIDAGPGARRSVLDWGMFHVKQHYLTLWKEYKRVLKQRNQLLKQNAAQSYFIPWNKLLSDLAEELHLLRQNYFFELLPIFHSILAELSTIPCTLNYFKGWDKRKTNRSLLEILDANFEMDRARQFTQQGAHQADLFIETDNFSAKQALSRGQQKIVLIALKLAQTHFLSKPCVFLCDDVMAELDNFHQKSLLNKFYNTNGQFFITSTTELNLESKQIDSDYSYFKLNQGHFA